MTNQLKPTTNELEFLPAALEIVETPPLPASRFIVWAILLFFSIGIVWAYIGEVDIVGVAQGKIVPSGNVKVIQSLETGTVNTIYVKEGQLVKQGEPLIELDTTLNLADQANIEEQQLALKLDRARIKTLLGLIGNRQEEIVDRELGMVKSSVDSNDLNPNINTLTPIGATPTQISIMQQRIDSEHKEYTSSRAALQDEIAQRRAELNAIKQRIQQLDSTIPLIEQRSQALKDMVDKSMVPKMQWLELEQERIEQTKERDVQRETKQSVVAAIQNTKQRQSMQSAEFEKQLLTDLSEVENRIASFEQEKVKANKRVALQTLTAPVDGKVHQLTIHTIGGVVTPAQELMRIVPEEGAMEIEAWVQNKDIGFVNEGQEAEIKVETFPFTKYGTIDGEIQTLSNDATPDEQLGLVYATRVSMEKTTMHIKDKIINLSPGMAVTVEMNMGKRRLIEYLLSPLLRYKDESVRER